MIKRLPLAAALALLVAAGAMAQPLPLPAGAVQIGARADAPARYALPIAAFDGTAVPTQTVLGALDQQAWRIDGLTINTLSLLQPLGDALVAQGYKVVFTCEAVDCGGFDFRFGIDVLPEPQMHVDLGDYRYLAATMPNGNAVTLLVSRTADQGFVQITSITVAGQAPAPLSPATASSATASPAAPAIPVAAAAPPEIVPTPPAPELPAPPPGDFASQLMTAGSVALDDLIFASGKSALQDQDYASLAALAVWLKDQPDMRVTLVGHTDATGTLSGNVTLSRQRAQSVRDWLVRRYGVSAAQIDAQGAGYLSPRATNQTAEGRTRNRRVEVMLTSLPGR